MSFPLQPVTSIGRSPANTIVIPDTYASSQHALLTWREGRWWLRDRDSRNGTLLNAKPVEEPTVVATGDVIGVGQTKIRLEIDDA
jgi:pSer/pThr/pTyr-binding forkhead associated (FHA) protein